MVDITNTLVTLAADVQTLLTKEADRENAVAAQIWAGPNDGPYGNGVLELTTVTGKTAHVLGWAAITDTVQGIVAQSTDQANVAISNRESAEEANASSWTAEGLTLGYRNDALSANAGAQGAMNATLTLKNQAAASEANALVSETHSKQNSDASNNALSTITVAQSTVLAANTNTNIVNTNVNTTWTLIQAANTNVNTVNTNVNTNRSAINTAQTAVLAVNTNVNTLYPLIVAANTNVNAVNAVVNTGMTTTLTARDVAVQAKSDAANSAAQAAASASSLHVDYGSVTTALGFIPANSNGQNFPAGTLKVANVAVLTGNQTITVTGDATGSGTTAIGLTLAASGVTAGAYGHITVDAKGRVTAVRNLNSGDITGALGYTPANDGAVLHLTGGTLSGGMTVQPSGLGGVGFVAGTAANSGYTAWYSPTGTRLGYSGFGVGGSGLTGAMTDSTTSLVFGTNGTTRMTLDGSSGWMNTSSHITAGGNLYPGGQNTYCLYWDGSNLRLNHQLYVDGNISTGNGLYAGGVCSTGNMYYFGSTGSGVDFRFDGSQVVLDGTSFYVAGNTNANNTYTRSDRRIKWDIAPSPDYGATIDLINVVTFNKQGCDKPQVGVVAQELEEIVPDAVIDGTEPFEGGDPLKSVDTNHLLFMMLKDYQSSRARIAALEARIAELEAAK